MTVPPFERLRLGTARAAQAMRWLMRGGATHESVATYLHDVSGENVDRSLVSHWCGGKRDAPLEAWLAGLEHVNRPDLVLDALAGEHGCVVVRAPVATPGARPAPSRRALLISALAGEVSRLTAEATDPDSAGGADLTAAELAVIADVERQLARVLATPHHPQPAESAR